MEVRPPSIATNLRSQTLRLRDEARGRAICRVSLRDGHQQFLQHHPLRLTRHPGRLQRRGIRSHQPPLCQEVEVKRRVLPASEVSCHPTHHQPSEKANGQGPDDLRRPEWPARENHYLDHRPEILLQSDIRRRGGTESAQRIRQSVDFSGIAFLTEPRNASPIISRLLDPR